MKRHLPTFLAGMLVAAFLGSISALAISSRMSIEVDPISIQVNGQTFVPKDVTGQEVPVFSYNGTTYAPLRALAEAYGLEVGYDAEKNMATVSRAAEETQTADNSPELDVSTAAKLAYDLIGNAESLCKQGMGAISAAWHFGIYDAPDCTTDMVMERLSAQMGFDVDFVTANGGYTADKLVNGTEDFSAWEFCLTAAENCISAAGTHDTVKQALDGARDLIQALPEDHSNFQDLKNYYTKVAAYAAFFGDISGSYNDVTAAITEHEYLIKIAKEPLLFDLG